MKTTNENKLTFAMALAIFGVCVIFGWTLYSYMNFRFFLAVLFCVMSIGIATTNLFVFLQAETMSRMSYRKCNVT